MNSNISAFSVPEPEVDLKAQVDSLFNPVTSRHTIWLDDTDVKNLVIKDLGEGLSWAAIPGKGHVVTKSGTALQDIVMSAGSPEAIQKALGYSQPKDFTDETGSKVLQVVDPLQGGVAWEQAYSDDEQAEHRAIQAARNQLGAGQVLRVLPVLEALQQRLMKDQEVG